MSPVSARFVIFTIICLAFLFNTTNAVEGTLKEGIFTGVITGNRVNVRAGSEKSFEVICQLNQGEEVNIIERSNKWYKIELPRKALVYVHKTNVDRKDSAGVVKEDKSNVRAAATESSSIVGRLNKGANVKVLKEYLDWYEIEAPQGSFGWVHSDFVREKGQVEPRKTNLLKDKLENLNEAYNLELKKPLREIDLDKIAEDYQGFIVEFKGSPEAEEVVKKLTEVKMKIAELEHLKAKEEYEMKLKGISSPRPGEEPIASGIIEDVGRIYGRISEFKLVKAGKIIGYLTSNKVDLNKYVNLEVNLWGIRKQARSGMLLIEVDAVQIIQ